MEHEPNPQQAFIEQKLSETQIRKTSLVAEQNRIWEELNDVQVAEALYSQALQYLAVEEHLTALVNSGIEGAQELYDRYRQPYETVIAQLNPIEEIKDELETSVDPNALNMGLWQKPPEKNTVDQPTTSGQSEAGGKNN